QLGDLAMVSADRSTGYIHARRTIQPHTFGENVGIWVTSLSPTQTKVEVASRQAGPPVFWLKNWEKDILSAVAANLTREVPTATGGIGASSYSTTGSGSSVTVTTPGTTTLVTPPPPKTTADYIADQQRRLDDLRREEDLRLKELDREKDVT